MKCSCVSFQEKAVSLALLLIQWEGTLGMPVNEQRIYFPGEQYQQPVDLRSYGTDQSLHHVSDNNGNSYTHNRHYAEGYVAPYQQSEAFPGQKNSYRRAEQESALSGLLESGTRHEASHPADAPTKNDQTGQLQQTLLHYQPIQEIEPHHSQSEYTYKHYAHQGPHSQLQRHETEQEHRNRLFKSSYSAAHSHQVSGNSQTENSNGHDQKYGTHNFQSGYHKTSSITNPEDLTSILNQPLKEQAKQSELHPNIKEAIDNIMKEMETSSNQKEGQKAQHNSHKISYVKHTNVHKTGLDPGQSESSHSNGNINVSELLEQLHQLEKSPSHRNITWCEEKIKEFLRVLQHKQANGIYISQKVQEQTLHQILMNGENNHESINTEEVYEPPFLKVTIQPLGNELHEMHIPQHSEDSLTQESSLMKEGSYSQKQEASNNSNFTQETDQAVKNAISFTTQQYETFSGPMQQNHYLQPEIMSHTHQQQSQSPPFTSDNINLSGQTGSELPGLEQSMSEEASVSQDGNENFGFQNNVVMRPAQEDTHKALSKTEENSQEALSHIISGSQQDINYGNIGVDNSYNQFNSESGNKDIIKEDNHSFLPDPNIPDGFQPRPLGQLDLELPEYFPGNDPNIPQGFQPRPLGQLDLQLPEYHSSGESSVERKDEEHTNLDRTRDGGDTSITNSETPQDNNIILTHETLQNNTISHQVYGRPEASREELEEQETSGSYNMQKHNTIYDNHQQNGKKDEATEQQTEDGFLNANDLHNQQVNYETLIEELIQLESMPGHQAIDKCEEKILEFLEILKYQQELGFGKNQHELARLHQTLIEQTEKQSQHPNIGANNTRPISFWKKLQKKIKTTYEKAKDTAKKAVGY